MIASLSALDPAALLADEGPKRALLLGRDGSGPDSSLMDALRRRGAEVTTDPGRGWGAALARPQSTSPTALFETVNAWLAEVAAPADREIVPHGEAEALVGDCGSRVRETPVIFEGGGRQLYAVIAEPVDAPRATLTLILYNAGAIRRVGPNRMWTETARRWAAAGVPVIRVDVEGIGDADGDGGAYRQSDDPFYTQDLIDQARAALDLAVERGLPDRFALGGLCSGGFWAFQAALSDPRVRSVIMLNPRLLFFDPDSDGQRELRKVLRLFTASGIRNLKLEKLSMKRAARLAGHLLRRRKTNSRASPAEALKMLRGRGQHVAMGFSGEEPLYDELRAELTVPALETLGVSICELPYRSHTLKPLKAREAGHAMIDEALNRMLAAR
jgi:hypothetical protein